MKARSAATPDWKKFEQLVARIEALAAPLGVTVRSPDRVPSLLTGKMREVDASMRATVGTASLLVTVECRKRRHKQDVTWVEQLATKRQAIGAARTIAVSPIGFSEQAVTAAAHYGIELRVLSEIKAADLEGWLPRINAFIHVYNHCTPRSVDLTLSPPTSVEADAEWKRNAVGQVTSRDNVIVRPDGSATSIEALWIEAQGRKDYYYGLVPDGPTRTESVRLVSAEDNMRVRAGDMLRPVAGLNMTVELAKRVEEISVDAARVVEYQGTDGSKVQRIEIETQKARTNVRAAVQASSTDGTVRVTAELLPPSTDSDLSDAG
jgi:hypothetical protein